MKTYAIPDQLLLAAVSLLERLPAQKDVRAVLNGLEHCVAQQNQAEAAASKDVGQAAIIGKIKSKGGGGPGEEPPPPKK